MFQLRKLKFKTLVIDTKPQLSFRSVTISDICKSFKGIKTKVKGIDGLSVKLIAPILPALLPALTHVINASLKDNIFLAC
ncbi:hypothetical protein PR048_012997 [Dryococelus australis]|uniref:Uncharacterized protein n=1 Tax=Dryococelus australis TaxID=614101 RepID=A0ABQ9HQY1_9NEOP|nr:hypothetical protein PR048_012997 [Dryococelus australis]